MSTATTALPKRVRGALLRYRVMAYVTGTLLLVLTVAVIWKYTAGGKVADDLTAVVGFAHGWLFVVYLVTVLNLGILTRMNWWRLIGVALCGFIPIMTFVAERSTTRKLVHGGS